MGGGTDPRMRPDVRITRLTYQVATSGNPVPFLPAYANSSYHLDFDGPSLRCQPASDAIVLNVTSDLGTNRAHKAYQKWASWTGQYPTGQFSASDGSALERSEHSDQHGSRLSVMTNRIGEAGITSRLSTTLIFAGILSDKSSTSRNVSCSTHRIAWTLASKTELRHRNLQYSNGSTLHLRT